MIQIITIQAIVNILLHYIKMKWTPLKVKAIS